MSIESEVDEILRASTLRLEGELRELHDTEFDEQAPAALVDPSMQQAFAFAQLAALGEAVRLIARELDRRSD